MLSSGTKIAKYTIDSLIGEGATGYVYKAFEADRDHPVALKMLNEEATNSVRYRDQLKTEAELNASIESDYVVKVWEYGESEGQPYIAMEFVAGEDLRTSSSQPDFDSKLDLLCRIGEGVGAAHARGLIHRDLKPENIRLSSDGSPRILDFGLAKAFDEDAFDESGDVEGTLHYLSPEQLSGEPLTAGSDLFSLGTIAYELLCERRPFEGDYAAAVIYSILHEEPIPPSDVNESLPKWVNVLISKLLAKRPGDRFETARDAIDYIEKWRAEGTEVDQGWVRPQQTVTVVDLKNLSNDESWDYFCEGFTDDVIRELTRRTNMLVSAEPTTTHKRDIRETFAKCRSDYVVVGSLMKWQDKIKLNLAVHTEDGNTMVWSETYSDLTDNLFELLARAAQETSVQLSQTGESKPLEAGEEYQPDFSAYDLYLKGKNYYQTNRPDDLDFARGMFERALEADPHFAPAHAGLSDVYTFKYMAYYDRTPECIAQAKKQALLAIEKDPSAPEAHRSLARFYMFTGDVEKARQSLLKAVDLNPKYAIGYRTLAWLSQSQQECDDARKWVTRALELAPTDLETLLLLSLLNINQRKFAAAIATLKRAIELGPDYGRAYYNLGLVYLKLGTLDQAHANFELAAKYKGDPNCCIDAGYVLLVQAKYDEARASFHQSLAAGYFPFASRYYLGLTDLLAGDKASAASNLEQALTLMEGFDFSQPQNAEVKSYYALALAGLDRTDEAGEILQELAELTGVAAEVQYNIARAYAAIGDDGEAEQLLRHAIMDTSGPTLKEIAMDPHFARIPLDELKSLAE